MEFRPDLLHLQIQHTDVIDGNTIKKIKDNLPNCIVTNWTGDVRNYVPRTYKRIAAFSDYNLISSTGQLDMFKKELGKDVRYWQIGYNPSIYYPSPEPKKHFLYDASFIANNNTKENYPGRSDREQICQKLREAFGKRFGLFGNGWPRNFRSRGGIEQSKVCNEVYHNSVCCISVSHYNDLNHYFSDRLLMCLASGRPTVSLRFPKWQSYFANNCDIVIADSIDDIIVKVKELVADPDRANFIGQSGAQKVFAEHTYYSRIKELLDMVGLK